MDSEKLAQYAKMTVEISTKSSMLNTQTKDGIQRRGIIDFWDTCKNDYSVVDQWLTNPEYVITIDEQSLASSDETDRKILLSGIVDNLSKIIDWFKSTYKLKLDILENDENDEDAWSLEVIKSYINSKPTSMNLGVAKILKEISNKIEGLEKLDYSDILNRLCDESNLCNKNEELDITESDCADEIIKIHSMLEEYESKIIKLTHEIQDRFNTLKECAKYIVNKCSTIYKETSIYSLYVGAYYLNGRYEKTKINAPIILYPVEIIINPNCIQIKHCEFRDTIINHILLIWLQEVFGCNDCDFEADAFNYDEENIVEKIKYIILL